MKKILLLLTGLALFTGLFSQAPQGFNYQAVARDANGDILAETALSVRIGILQDDAIVWQEVHDIATNKIGLFTLVIGDPDAGGSGSAGSFADIQWGTGVYTIKVDINDGSGFTDFPAQPINSVPYALHAANGPVGPKGDKGDKGDPGEKGDMGESPSHEWQATQLRFENPDGSWGNLTDLKGEKGDKGEAGTGLNNRGAWTTGTTYNPGDYVFDDASGDPTKNSMWILEGDVAYTSNTNPNLDPDHWVEFEAPEGPQGPKGDKGDRGDIGPEGPKGDKPAHEWVGTALRFQKPDNTWGEAVDLKGDPSTNTDNQELSLAGTDLSISGGNTISLAGLPDAVNDADADPANELQTLAISDHQLTITDGNTVTLPDNVNDADADPGNEIQAISLTGNLVELSKGGGSFTLPPDSDGDPTNELQSLGISDHLLSISNGNSVTLPDNVNDADANPTNEIQVLSRTGNLVQLSNGGGSITLPAELDGDPTNEIQILSITGEVISLSRGGGSVNLPFDDVNDADYDPTNEIQDLRYTGGVISLTNDPTPTSINLPNIIAGESGWDINGDTVKTGNPVKINTKDPQVITPLFEVKNDLGNPVFAVFNDGVVVYVDESKKGVKGGFAVGGYSNTSKGPTQEYLRVTPDSVRVWVNDAAMAKGVKGGFAVGGYQQGKAETDRLMSITNINYLIGQGAGAHITTGYDNSLMGYKSGYNVTSGHDNIFLGDSSGYSATTAFQNIFIGNKSGFSNMTGQGNLLLGNGSGYRNTSSYNAFLGYQSGYNNTTGNHNIFIGYWAGKGPDDVSGLTGSLNTFIGDVAGSKNTSGSNNLFLGPASGANNTTGQDNIFLGNFSGYNNQTGSYNTFIGYFSGLRSGLGGGTISYNTFLGYQTGLYNETGQFNTYLGYRAGYSGVGASGSNNVMVGSDAGFSNTSGNSNVFLGYRAGVGNTDGLRNIIIGEEAGLNAVHTAYNVFIGYRSGYSNNGTGVGFNGNYNVFMGYQAGFSNISGGGSVIIGYNAATNTQNNNYVTAIGYAAGEGSQGGYNVFVGGECGKQHGTGNYNAFYGMSAGVASNGSYNSYLGAWSGWHNDGDYNTAVGYSAGYGANTYAYYRGTYLGSYSGYSQTTGSNNTFIGYNAGRSSTSGAYNLMMGYESGYQNATGSGNVFLGYQAGYYESTSNKLYISNSSTTTPLIYGDFSSQFLRFNGNVAVGATPGTSKFYSYDSNTGTNDYPAIYGSHALVPFYGIGVQGDGGYIGVRGNSTVSGTGTRYGVYGYASGGTTNNYAVYAAGNLAYTGSLINASDAKFKTNVNHLDPVLNKLMSVQPKKYAYVDDENSKSLGLPDSEHYGFIAQELELIFPELVVDVVHPSEIPDDRNSEIHYKGVKYMEMIPILLQAIQEQQQEIEQLRSENVQLNEIMQRLSALEAQVSGQ